MPQGTGFINLSRLLDLNQETANRMAGEMGDSIESRGKSSVAGMNDGLAGLNGQVQSGILQYDPKKMMETRNFNSDGFGKYSGPEDFQYGDQLRSDTLSASRDARLANTDSGRQALLRTKGGSGGYGSVLDSALMGAAGHDRFRSLNDQYGGLEKTMTDNTKSAFDTIQSGRDQSQANSDKMFADRTGLVNKDKEERAESWRTGQDQRQQQQNKRTKETTARRGALGRMGG